MNLLITERRKRQLKECNTLISFCVVAYNEETTIQSLLDDVLIQTYPHKLIEILLVDGCSSDKTKEIMSEFAALNRESFYDIKVLNNEKKTLPCGWNVALENYHGEAIVRVDAHAHIPEQFIENNVKHLNDGEYVCGGYRPNIIDDETLWKKMLLSAESSMFGSSIADYRRKQADKCVNSIFHGAYRREVFDKIGKYDERLTRTEDNDIHYRIRQAGFDIHFHPDIVSYQHTRNSLKKMIKQKYLNGFWIGQTMHVNPKCFSLYHFVPMLFVLGILLTTVLYIINMPLLGNIMWLSYWILNIVMAVFAFINDKGNYTYLILPVVFFILHLVYGIGTLWGIIKKW